MKTYLLNIPQRLKLKSQELDVQAVLCNKAWSVFNDEGVKQLFIFQPDGTLYITTNGSVSNGTWKYIPANQSIIISSEGKSVMFHPAFLDDVIFALQQDGEGSCLFMIDEKNKPSFSPKSLTELGAYFTEKELALIEEDRRKEKELLKESLGIERQKEVIESPKAKDWHNKDIDNHDNGDITEMLILSALIAVPASIIPGFFWAWHYDSSVLEGMLVWYMLTFFLVAILYYFINYNNSHK